MSKKTVQKHFVTFYSPGTFVPEETSRPIESWDAKEAVKMSREIKERYGATPYGFRFSTRGRSASDLDSSVLKTSGMYYIGGRVETIEDVRARATKDDEILLWNMEHNDIKRIVTNDNSWRFTAQLEDDDIVLTVD